MAYSTQGLPTTNLQPGTTGPQVKALQQWLVNNGLMTQAQMNTGAGIYGPQTTAAVAKLQSQLGVDNSTGVGYFGPRTISAIQTSAQAPQNAPGKAPGATATPAPSSSASTQPGQIYTYNGRQVYDFNGHTIDASNGQIVQKTSAPVGGVSSNITITPTGDPGLDQVLGSIKGVADGLISNGYTIPTTLQITPALVSQFLSYAHQAIDPYSQQLLNSRITDVNASLKDLSTQFANSTAERQQQFGTNLALEQNTAGASGTAFSGQRALNENNLASTANRDLSTLGANAAYSIGATARAGAADVGAANANNIVLPGLSTGSVSLAGGSRGSAATSGPLSYDYNPSLYTVGKIPSDQTQAVNQQQQSYLSQYGTLAGANSNGSRSVGDLIGMMSGLPSGYTVPSNLK